MDYKGKRITLIILLSANFLLFYFYFFEPVYFLRGSDSPQLVPENIFTVNKNLSKLSKDLFPVFSVIFMIYGLIKFYRRSEDFSILMLTASFIIICFLNICYRFF